MEPSVDVDIQVAIKEACKLADRQIQIDLLPKTDTAEVEFSYDPVVQAQPPDAPSS